MGILGQDHAAVHSWSYDGPTSTWTYPSILLLLIPPTLLTLQSTLLFIPSSSSTIRLALLPLSLLAIWYSCSIPDKSFFHPMKDFVHLNTVIQLAKFWACMRAIEFAISDKEEYKWIGYEKAYSDVEHKSDKKKKMTYDSTYEKEKNNDSPTTLSNTKNTNDNSSKSDEIVGSRNPFLLGWLNLCSLRGIGFQWGIRNSQIPPPHPADHFIPSLLLRIIWSHILTILSVAFVVYHRQNSSLHTELLQTYIPSLPRSNVIIETTSRLIQVIIFGGIVYTSLECGYSLLTFLSYILTSITRLVLPSKGPLTIIRPDKFRKEAWPRLSEKPNYSNSLSDFWGNRWHALFRRIFIVVGARPLSNLPEKLGFFKNSNGKNWLKVSLGAIGAFMTSGILHECFNEATPWLPRDPNYTVFKFFTLQAFGMIFEKALMKSILGGSNSRIPKIFGRIWCWSFLLFTGLLMTECWIDRGIVDNQPPIESWTWWRWCLPLAFIIPDLNNVRLHQLKHLS